GSVLSELLTIADAGDIAEPDAQEAQAIATLQTIAEKTQLLLALGGDNALTYSVASAVLGNHRDTAGIITLDAHHDLRDGV
ncbi:arginase family protein, partial [Staphylococcus aureus]|nr:arginase family protein [Staphylococcus aureus]